MLVRETRKSGAVREPDAGQVNLIHAGVVFLSKDLLIRLENRLAKDLFGWTEERCMAPLGEVLSIDSEEYQLLCRIVAEDCEYRDAVVKWEVDGTVRHVLMDSFVARHAETDETGVYIVMRDMGNFALLNQHTEKIERIATIGRLAAGVAHEIRNPLTTIKGFLQLLEQRLERADMLDEIAYIRVMMQEIERVNALVTELLLLSKPQDMAWTDVSVPGLLAELRPWLDEEARKRGVETVYEVPAELELQADRGMMEQLFVHLARNAMEAMEAMEAGGRLTIRARAEDGRVELQFSDTGPGIPYYLFDRIFDVFYTTKEKGTGLGLAICQRIVADHGGQIRVSSKGFGTTFTVSLPKTRSSSVRVIQQRQSS
ncbi:PAS domain-containing protein [Alicyclobacillus mali]|uniref:histidine kinase n=1 Tax=Alicyclobacillus mali (ex Roth et al. 2021) TaxID=1123961 RepID=A0ABS0F3C7_9BACL|nr:ATP-binding protein [Alicyclobacillus mali (ex Roth et al. 2021)]MBF8377810.1 PAS domain-containing protein [Alicyclobacillus mali (ex Roth et al. 2021)]